MYVYSVPVHGTLYCKTYFSWTLYLQGYNSEFYNFTSKQQPPGKS